MCLISESTLSLQGLCNSWSKDTSQEPAFKVTSDLFRRVAD